jgi:UDP-N-acetylglucosamine 1-carboxyvinyltransferase
VQLSGAKNAALKLIIAALLFKNEVYLSNIPHIGDVKELLNLIRNLGGRADFIDKNQIKIDSRGINKFTINLLYASKIRVSFMMFAPLLYKFGRADIPNPGGCRIGARPIDRQIELMRQMGILVDYDSADGYYHAKLEKRIKGVNYTFEKPSHTGTEFAIMLGCLAEGETVIENASLEPEIDDLICFLNGAGGKIRRSGKKIYLSGVKQLTAKEPYSIKNDRNEAVTYAIFALATKGDVLILGIEANLISSFIKKVEESGGGVKIYQDKLRVVYKGKLRATDIITRPHPGFMTDWQAPWAVLMTQAWGVSTIHETVFENRFSYVEELRKLGAKIEYFQPKTKNPQQLYQFTRSDWSGKLSFPQAIKIFGKTPLHNAVLSVSDLRAGASLLIGAAVAYGESVIHGASVIDRGYEEIDKKLRSLGLKIKRI